jgi:hypothetical protein
VRNYERRCIGRDDQMRGSGLHPLGNLPKSPSPATGRMDAWTPKAIPPSLPEMYPPGTFEQLISSAVGVTNGLED